MGNLIRDARESRRLTRKQAAETLGLNEQYLYQVETGRRVPTLETLWEIAGAMGIDPHSLDSRLAPSRDRKGKPNG